MNRLIIFDQDIDDTNNILIKDELRVNHCKKVLGISKNDQIKVALIHQEQLGMALVEQVQTSSIKLQLLSTFNANKQIVNLIVGSSRPPTIKKVLEHGSTFGIKQFEIINSKLSEKSYLASKVYQNNKFKEYLHLGISQSAIYAKEPQLTLKKFFPNTFEHYPKKQRFVLDPYAHENLLDQDLTINDEITLAIGPERGWCEEELETFKNNGFTPVSLSPSILRVEMATYAALGIINAKIDKDLKNR